MKPQKSKILKIGTITTFSLGFCALIIGTSTSWNNLSVINCAGSSAVMPLMTLLSNKYKKADIVVQSGGSGVGISSILSGSKEIGMLSKNPHILDGDDTKKIKAWEEKKIKTFTIAWDGIAIVYKPKDSSSENVINLDENNFAKLYKCFSGVGNKLKMSDFGLVDDQSEIIPYARNGGGAISGTADSFYKNSNMNYTNSDYWLNLQESERKEIISVLENGNYGSHVKQTAEANSQAWNRVKNDNQIGSMVYLSTGFVLNNIKEIEEYGFKIAKYNNVDLSIEKITNGYDWFRPFNLLVSLKNQNLNIQEFIKWIYEDSIVKDLIRNEDYIPLNDKQINSMKKNDSFFDEEAIDYKLGYHGAQSK